MLLTPLQNLPKNEKDWGKLIVAKGIKRLPKVQNIAQSDHTGCHHSSVDSSALFILLPLVWLPNTPSMLVSFIVKFVLYLSLYCEKNEIKQKEVGFDPFLIKKQILFMYYRTLWSLSLFVLRRLNCEKLLDVWNKP